MLEKDMEELLARYPQDFFPRKNLLLKDRQRSFSGVGRFDLLFTDEYGTNILMELKARTAKYEDATQLAKYFDALKQLGEKNIIMWLVAPQIPNSIREFLDNIGIEYSEIHDSEYKRIADIHNYQLQTSQQQNITHVDEFPSNKTKNKNTKYTGAYRSTIQRNYRNRRDSLYNTFMAGYNFLKQVENNHHDIWLGTSTNVHLYLNKYYLCYIRIGNNGLTFRPRFNNQIYAGTEDRSDVMFSKKLKDLIIEHNGFKDRWATEYYDEIVFNNSTPAEFFDKLFAYIANLKFEDA